MQFDTKFAKMSFMQNLDVLLRVSESILDFFPTN